MSNIVQAKNAVMFGFLTGNWYPIGCETNFTYESSNELITKTDRNAGGNRKYRARISDGTASVEGVVTTTNIPESLTIFYYEQELIRRTVQQFKFLWTDDDGFDKEITANFVIRTISIANQQGGFSTFTMELQRTSAVTVDPVIPPDDGNDEGIDSSSWDTTEGETSITGDSVDGKSFVGKKILLVSRTGAPHNLVTGTPGNLEAQVSDPAGTTITFLNAFNPGETVFIVWEDA